VSDPHRVRAQRQIRIRASFQIDAANDLDKVAPMRSAKGGLRVNTLADEVKGHKLSRISDAR
jgi:hypothetical protein